MLPVTPPSSFIAASARSADVIRRRPRWFLWDIGRPPFFLLAAKLVLPPLRPLVLAAREVILPEPPHKTHVSSVCFNGIVLHRSDGFGD